MLLVAGLGHSGVAVPCCCTWPWAKSPGFQSPRFSDQLCASDKMAVISSNRTSSDPRYTRHSRHQSPSSSVDEIPRAMAYPWATEASQAGCSAVVTIIDLHIVVPTVSLLLDLKCLECQFHPITIFSSNHPFTVCLTWVVVVPKLSVGIQILSSYFSL